MRTLIETSQFRIDLKGMAKSGKYNKADLIEVLRHLEKDLPLPRNIKNMLSSGNGNITGNALYCFILFSYHRA